MELVADILLVAGALGAGFYCFVLARRLNRFNDLEKGVGGAVAVLSSQVDDLTKSLKAAQSSAQGSNTVLSDLTTRAEAVAGKLELMMASMHDLTEAQPTPADTTAENPRAAPEAGVMFVRHERQTAGARQ